MGIQIKSQRKDNCSIPPTEYNGNIYSGHSGNTESLNSNFCSVFTTRSCDECRRIEEASFPPISHINIDVNRVQLLLENLNVQKSTGPDCIPVRLCCPHISIIYIQQGCIPTEWNHANMVSIFKKSNQSMPSHYRPVSLTNIHCKQLQHIVYSHIFITIIYFAMHSNAFVKTDHHVKCNCF